MSRRIHALGAAVCVAGTSVIALAGAQSVSAEWSPVFQVTGVDGEPPVGDGITVNTGAAASGETVFVWTDADPFADPAVYARRLHTDGTLSPSVELTPDNTGLALADTGLDGTTAFAKGPFVGSSGHTGRLLSPSDQLGPVVDLWPSPGVFTGGTVVSSNGTAGFIGTERSETQIHYRYRRMTSGGLGPLQTLSTVPVGSDVGESPAARAPRLRSARMTPPRLPGPTTR